MAIFPVIVYGNGTLFQEFFNAIAATIGTSGFNTLMKIAIMLAGMTVAASFSMQRDLMVMVRWLGMFYVVCFLLLAPKATVEIRDSINHNSEFVDNVPLGLAVMASYTSAIGEGLTSLLESNFSMPDDLRYHQNGMVFASRLAMAASQVEIQDATFDQNLQDFIHQCVFYDLLLGKYSINDLVEAPDVWQQVTAHASPARAFTYNREIMTCREGAPKLSADWVKLYPQALTLFGRSVFPSLSGVEAKAKVVNDLKLSYAYLTHVSTSANDIMQKNLMRNAIQRGIVGMGAHLDASAAVESYAFARAQEQKRLNNTTLGDMAAHWLPLMKNAFEAIMYGCFILIVLLSVFPFGGQILKNYVYTLLWIQIWAPLYAIINLIVSYYAQIQSIGAAGSGLSLQAMSGLQQANSDISGLAGYLTLSVPFLSAGLVRGMAGTFTHLAQFVGGVTQSAAGTASAEAVTGNFGFGNTSFGNQNANNTNLNHFDSSARYSSGAMSTQLADGSMATTTAGGGSVLNMQSGISVLPAHISLASALRSSASRQFETAITSAENQTQASAEAQNSALRQAYDFNHQNSRGKSGSESWNHSENSSFSQAENKVESLINDFASRHNLSYGEGRSVLTQASASIGTGLAGKLLPVSAAGNRSSSHTGSIDHSTLQSDAESYVKNSGFTESVHRVEQAVHDKAFRNTTEQGDRLASGMAASFDQSNSYRKEAQISLNKAESARQSQSYIEDHAESINFNMTQQFSEWMINQPGTNGRGRLGVTGAAAMLRNSTDAEPYIQRFIDSHPLPQNSGFKVNQLSLEEDKVRAHFNEQKVDYSDKKIDSIKHQYISNKNEVNKNNLAKSLSNEIVSDKPMTAEYQGLKSEFDAQLSSRKSHVLNRGSTVKSHVQEEEKQQDKRYGMVTTNLLTGINTTEKALEPDVEDA